jgi:hypothetical protein
MLATVVAVLVAAVIVYTIWPVKPKRVRFRAGVGKFTVLDFEADASTPEKLGNSSGEPKSDAR